MCICVFEHLGLREKVLVFPVFLNYFSFNITVVLTIEMYKASWLQMTPSSEKLFFNLILEMRHPTPVTKTLSWYEVKMLKAAQRGGDRLHLPSLLRCQAPTLISGRAAGQAADATALPDGPVMCTGPWEQESGLASDRSLVLTLKVFFFSG